MKENEEYAIVRRMDSNASLGERTGDDVYTNNGRFYKIITTVREKKALSDLIEAWRKTTSEEGSIFCEAIVDKIKKNVVRIFP